MSIASTLSVARTAMNAHQTVIQTAGHNIANVATEGYSRQRVDLTPNTPQRTPDGSIGTGVQVQQITRAREHLLDAAYRREQGDAAGAALRHELLGGVEGVLGEPGDDGLAAAMDAFWSSWSDLANSPSNAAVRSVVRQRGANVATALNRFDAKLSEQRQEATLRVFTAIGEINRLADEVALLNGRIVGAEAGGSPANDLRDMRDRAIDGLAKHGAVRTIENRDGSVQVTLGNNGLVDGVTARHFDLTDDGTTLTVRFEGSAAPLPPTGGALTELARFVNVELPDVRGRLDTIARSLAQQVNAVHRQGQTFPGGVATPAGNFFHPGDANLAAPPALLPVTAGNIRLDSAIEASAANIAASAATPGAGNAAGPGNNEIALALADFRSRPATVAHVAADGTVERGSFGGFYGDTVTRLGTRVKDAGTTAAVHETLASQADARRTAASGVNLDEELTLLIRAQQAYTAAAKIVTVADEMMRTLVELV